MGLTKPKIVGGVSLPDLTDPAAAADILSGKEAIDEAGAVLTGSHVCKQLHELFPALTDPATAADVASGKQFVDSSGAVVTGSASVGGLDTTKSHELYGEFGGTTTTVWNGQWNDMVDLQLPTKYNKFYAIVTISRGYVVIIDELEKEVSLSTSQGYSYKIKVGKGSYSSSSDTMLRVYATTKNTSFYYTCAVITE